MTKHVDEPVLARKPKRNGAHHETSPSPSEGRRKRAVVVLGMHRSGTSLLTNLLNILGVNLGDDLLGASEFNQLGHWEHNQIYPSHDPIMDRLAPDKSGPGWLCPLPYDWSRLSEVWPFREKLTSLARREIAAANGIWGFKDPRTCRLLPLWNQIFCDLDVEPLYVLAFRDPAAVVKSLVTRNYLEPALIELLWLVHNLDAIHGAGPELRVVVDYDRWFTHPVEQARQVAEALELPWPEDDSSLIARLRDRIRPELRHSGPSRPPSLAYVAKTWEALRHAAASGVVPDDIYRIDKEVERVFRSGPRPGIPSRAAGPVQFPIDETACKTLAAEASQCMASRDFAGARERLTAACEIWPANAALALALGCVEMNAGNVEAALTAFAGAVKTDTEESKVMTQTATAPRKNGVPSASREATDHPDSPLSMEPEVTQPTVPQIKIQPPPLVVRPGIFNQSAKDLGSNKLVLTVLPPQSPTVTPAAAIARPSAPTPTNGAPAAAAAAGTPTEELRAFSANATDYFADVEPPQLWDIHLRRSRILPSRDHILHLMPKGGVCAEVGTQTGAFAKAILTVMKPSKLHIYDLNYSLFDRAHFQRQIDQGLVELHEGDSSSLLAELPDWHFDFIYVDGDHSYEGVKRDLAQAMLKIKEDGWIVCNDYTAYSPIEKIKYGVARAVNELCLDHGFEIVYLGLNGWGYHDVALRRRRTDGQAGAEPAVETQAVSPAEAGASPGKSTGKAGRAKTDAAPETDAEVRRLALEVGDDWKNQPYYDQAEQHIQQQWTAQVWPFIKDSDFSAVLDLAAGHGRNSEMLKEQARRIYVVDINQENIDYCRHRFAGDSRFTFIRNDGCTLPSIRKGSLTFIYCYDAMVHFDSDVVRAYLREFKRVLRAGGRGFCHHSNYTANPAGNVHQNPGWRNYMSKDLFAHYCGKEGLKVIKSIVIDWERPGSDCLTLFESR